MSTTTANVENAAAVPRTYGEAAAAGWRPGDARWERGYVSRRTDVSAQTVLRAGGTRRGQYYVLLPSRRSTLYCVRQYLLPPEG